MELINYFALPSTLDIKPLPYLGHITLVLLGSEACPGRSAGSSSLIVEPQGPSGQGSGHLVAISPQRCWPRFLLRRSACFKRPSCSSVIFRFLTIYEPSSYPLLPQWLSAALSTGRVPKKAKDDRSSLRMGMVFLAGLRRSIDVHCTDDGSRRLGDCPNVATKDRPPLTQRFRASCSVYMYGVKEISHDRLQANQRSTQ
ncbi:uncharacterized protein CLUP02_16165 [Colletotrichum lupini]|uniref:Uncharacterized protein n=1 Tax=Colletotrichum lupini TaxID=145971 RepID=A0A9Q8WPW8_9PEZI|nr:uncharacterized protein CLUP02_16165 [Colletotrichum lupini]UQC90635.1 hypothetical protein CLUP02_16165 [Colletotrichum lupini]